ncbi:MAG: SUMF1/EgtB/PvdO family nonheme iron enzyme, partial [Candidatus Cloacimonadaceae bacterium]|nr:SUMF1/EgtB/PvdO family nonheme iron enzyme [Candidatus Cloacimonadaceae bacterium]
MKNTLFIILLIIMIGVLSGQDAPIVSNVTLAQNGSMARISYDLLCSSPCQIILKISDDSGATFTIVPNSASLSGDFGSLVNPGTGKVIHWNIASDGIQGSGFRARVIARNLDEDVFVEGGLIGIHTVSDFYIGRHELTQAEYFITMGYNPAQSFGVGDNYPIHSVNWFDAIEYCNRRSMMDGYIPCYSFEGLGTDPDLWPIGWKTINDNQNKIFWDWTANGYRLPTTEEWKFAAKGGNQSMDYRFSGSDIANEVAWHSGNCDPYSCMPVGLKLPNELGIYDMSGNQSEWRWDFYWPFGTISTPSSDPTGPFFGITKIHGGGSWDFGLPPVTTITTSLPSVGYVHNGFRIARSATFPSTTLPTPVIGVDSGSYSTTKIVHITTSLSGASIRYTIDGSTPSKDHGKVYTQPIVINKSTVLKAIAINNGFFPSQVVTRTYTIWISAPEPLLPVAGGTFHNGTSNITISSFHMDKFEV